jgi:hypothetical protein
MGFGGNLVKKQGTLCLLGQNSAWAKRLLRPDSSGTRNDVRGRWRGEGMQDTMLTEFSCHLCKE